MKSEKETLTEVLGKEYTVQGPDGPMKVDGLGVVIRRVVKDAADGKVGAIKALFARIDAHGIGASPAEPELSEADQDIAIALLRRYGLAVTSRKDESDDED